MYVRSFIRAFDSHIRTKQESRRKLSKNKVFVTTRLLYMYGVSSEPLMLTNEQSKNVDES